MAQGKHELLHSALSIYLPTVVLVQKNIEAQALLLLASRRELGTAPPKTHRRERREKRGKEQATAGGLGLHRTDAALTGGKQIRGCDLQHERRER
jgi:hypothetical protein